MPKQSPSLKTARADRSKISMQNEIEVKYWTRHLGITRKQLQNIIEKVGNSAASIRKELKRTQQDSAAGANSDVD